MLGTEMPIWSLKFRMFVLNAHSTSLCLKITNCHLPCNRYTWKKYAKVSQSLCFHLFRSSFNEHPLSVHFVRDHSEPSGRGILQLTMSSNLVKVWGIATLLPLCDMTPENNCHLYISKTCVQQPAQCTTESALPTK